MGGGEGSIHLFVLFGLYVAFSNLLVISRLCLDVAGSSVLTFRKMRKPKSWLTQVKDTHLCYASSTDILTLISPFSIL